MDFDGLDDAHLSALVRALHEARFCERGSDPVVFGSPLVADLHCWALAEQERRRPTPEARLSEWLEWRGRPERATVVRRLRERKGLWDAMLRDPELVRHLLRPFTLDDDDVAALIQEVEE